jgi:hypothetical protein
VLVTSLVHELFVAASAQGHGGAGIWNVIEPLRSLAGQDAGASDRPHPHVSGGRA